MEENKKQENFTTEDKKDDLIEKIRAKIEELERERYTLSPEEKEIIQKMKETLGDHHLKCVCDPDRPRMLEIPFNVKNKPLRMQIVLENKRILFRLVFTFRVQCNSLALVALYMAEFNHDKAFSSMKMNLDEGEVTIGYAYLLGKLSDFNPGYFWIYVSSLIQPALEVYTRLQHLAVGKVSKEIKDYYKILLEKSLAVINEEEEEEEDIIFGSEGLEKRKSAFLEKLQKLKIFDSPGESEDDSEDPSVPFLSEDDSERDETEEEFTMPFEEP